MSWSYSQVLVAEYSDQCCSDIDASALLNTTPMPDQFYWPDKTTEHSRLSRFGMTCVPLTESHGAELLMSFLEDFRARTSALQEAGPDWTASGQGYGEKWLGLLGRFDPDSCSLKTAQCSLFEDLTECSPTLPRWGLMLDGELYPQPTPALCTEETECGSWAYKAGLTQKPTHNIPTPTASDHIERKSTSKEVLNFKTNKTVSLDRWVKYWPTPTVCGNYNRPGMSSTSGMGLASAVMDSDGGQLSPDWVEWLMGWPIGHTDLKPLATARFREFVRQHGLFSTETREAA